jgi:mannose-6-phosphate isomerase
MLYPLIFRPIFKDRVWGGRKLADLYGKPLPEQVRIGESWEISDRPGDASVIVNGALAGKDLRWLMQNHASELLGGDSSALPTVFPLLIKILDAREKLSLQVHPPTSKAKAMGGEPKTEMWYIADAGPTAELYVGIKRGVTREEFQDRIHTGGVSDCFHKVPVKAGDTMFLPSGRVHAIGANLVIFEIQQNSDTTYRVYDWNRAGLDGKPRQLHIQESMASIDFDDFEPRLVHAQTRRRGAVQARLLVSDPLFEVSECSLEAGAEWIPESGEMRIIGVLKGTLTVRYGSLAEALPPGGFCLLPASVNPIHVHSPGGAQFLDIKAGNAGPHPVA